MKVIGVGNLKGGVGKTTTSMNQMKKDSQESY